MQAAAQPIFTVGGTSASGQIMYGFVIIVVLFLLLFLTEILVATSLDIGQRFVTLLDRTASAETRSLVLYQDPTKFKDAKPLGLSVNERTGIEFGYSFFLFVEPSTFSSGDDTLKHVFHKGFQFPWPLMGPGVFIRGNENTMRVIMNTYSTPYNKTDIKNIPVGKWFHVVLNCYKGGLDVYVNGILASRIPFKGTMPYQNYGNIYLFSNINSTEYVGDTKPVSLSEDFRLAGSFTGYLSKLVYARYAFSVGEIQNLLRAGPSTKIEERAMSKPPYLADDWWSNLS